MAISAVFTRLIGSDNGYSKYSVTVTGFEGTAPSLLTIGQAHVFSGLSQRRFPLAANGSTAAGTVFMYCPASVQKIDIILSFPPGSDLDDVPVTGTLSAQQPMSTFTGIIEKPAIAKIYTVLDTQDTTQTGTSNLSFDTTEGVIVHLAADAEQNALSGLTITAGTGTTVEIIQTTQAQGDPDFHYYVIYAGEGTGTFTIKPAGNFTGMLNLEADGITNINSAFLIATIIVVDTKNIDSTLRSPGPFAPIIFSGKDPVTILPLRAISSIDARYEFLLVHSPDTPKSAPGDFPNLTVVAMNSNPGKQSQAGITAEMLPIDLTNTTDQFSMRAYYAVIDATNNLTLSPPSTLVVNLDPNDPVQPTGNLLDAPVFSNIALNQVINLNVYKTTTPLLCNITIGKLAQLVPQMDGVVGRFSIVGYKNKQLQRKTSERKTDLNGGGTSSTQVTVAFDPVEILKGWDTGPQGQKSTVTVQYNTTPRNTGTLFSKTNTYTIDTFAPSARPPQESDGNESEE